MQNRMKIRKEKRSEKNGEKLKNDKRLNTKKN